MWVILEKREEAAESNWINTYNYAKIFGKGHFIWNERRIRFMKGDTMAKARKKSAPIVEKTKNSIEDLGVKLGLIRRVTVREQQEFQSDVVREAQNLRMKLQTIPYSVFERKADNTELLQAHASRIAVLAHNLERQDVAFILDTREMDRVMYHLCDRLTEAYQLGDMETAEKIIDALVYGIVTGHKPLLTDEREQAETVLQAREKRLQSYLKIAQISHNAYQHKLVIEELTKKLDQSTKDWAESDRKAIEFKTGHAEAWEEICNAGAHISGLKGNAFTLAQMIKQTVHQYKEIKLLETRIGLEHTELLQCQTMISNVFISLQKANEMAKNEIMEFARSLNQETMEQLNKQVQDIIAVDSTLDDFYRAVESVIAQPNVEKYAAGALDQYEMMKEEIRREAEANARLLEKEKFNELDQEAEDSLFQEN